MVDDSALVFGGPGQQYLLGNHGRDYALDSTALVSG